MSVPATKLIIFSIEDSGHDANFVITGGIMIVRTTISGTIDDKASW